MGQTISNHFEDLKDGCMKQANILKEVIDITHEEFLEKVKELNKICGRSIKCENRKLHFFVKKDTDTTIFWKQKVRILCLRFVVSDETETLCEEAINELLETAEEQVEVFKLLTLREFLVTYKMIFYHLNIIQDVPSSQQGHAESLPDKPISTSMLLDKIMADTDQSDADECIICMERKPEITLPCAHAYCLFCIEQWNVSNKTCPVCRAEMENTDESWVTPEIPESSEMNAEIQKALSVFPFTEK